MEKKFKKEVWIGVGLILGSIAIFLVASTLLSDQMAAMSKSVAEGRVRIAKRAELLGNLAQIKTMGSEAAIYQQKMNSILPSEEQLLNFPQILSSLASTRGVSFSFSFRGAPTKPQGTSPGVVAFTLDSSGSMDALDLFLNDIEPKATKFLISIDSFNLSESGQDYAINIQGRAFFR